MTTTTNIIELRKLAEAATPGEWVYSKERDTHDSPIHVNAPIAPDTPTYTADYFHTGNGDAVAALGGINSDDVPKTVRHALVNAKAAQSLTKEQGGSQ